MAGEIERREGEIAGRNRDLEEAIAHRTAELERALGALKGNEAKRRQLLADVSHELRTPLTIIRGEADVALRGLPKTPEAYREALERTRSTAEHAARIVDDLLFVARRDAGEAQLRLEEVNLATLVPDWFVSEPFTPRPRAALCRMWGARARRRSVPIRGASAR